MQEAHAFAPGNISCFFKIHPQNDPRWRGSLGLGFTVNEGVLVTVTKARETTILFNDRKMDFLPVRYVIDHLTKETVKIVITSPLPLGCGFGLSGASALATAYALNTLFSLEKLPKDLAILAHTADAFHQTGLGDVVNQFFGGFLVKLKPSSEFTVQKIPLTRIPVYYAYFSELSTVAVLSDRSLQEKINDAASEALSEVEKALKKSVRFRDLIDISYVYCKKSGLLQDRQTKDTIAAIQRSNGHASMIILGNAVYSDIPFEGSKKLMISDIKAHIL
ncbi:MAG: hypothetical protein HY430_01410 [Candidatus Levybacteria bacterium]|nr:hypothetical protein [Candidatus Levybacteria bacterium]